MGPHITWLATPGFPAVAPHGLPALPWISIKVDPLDQTEPDYPTDECIRR